MRRCHARRKDKPVSQQPSTYDGEDRLRVRGRATKAQASLGKSLTPSRSPGSALMSMTCRAPSASSRMSPLHESSTRTAAAARTARDFSAQAFDRIGDRHAFGEAPPAIAVADDRDRVLALTHPLLGEHRAVRSGRRSAASCERSSTRSTPMLLPPSLGLTTIGKRRPRVPLPRSGAHGGVDIPRRPTIIVIRIFRRERWPSVPEPARPWRASRCTAGPRRSLPRSHPARCPHRPMTRGRSCPQRAAPPRAVLQVAPCLTRHRTSGALYREHSAPDFRKF